MTVYTGGYKNSPDARSLRGAITYVAGTTGAIGSTPLFTVTGDVKLLYIGAKCTTDLTSGGAPTWDLGVVGNTSLITSGVSDVTAWDVGEWADLDIGGYQIGGMTLDNAITNGGGANVSGNIIQTINGATITAGVVRWYLHYIPLSGDGLVTLHANLVAF